jgi:tetratricopeptide (TPR) repeat protein
MPGGDPEERPAQESPAPEQPDGPPSREEEDKRLAADLARRGVAPDEIKRLLSLSTGKGIPSSKTKAGPIDRQSSPAPETPKPEPFVPKSTIVLPTPKETSAADQVAVDRLLSLATVARRRSDFASAEARCREAIDLAPGDASALELYGDVLQGLGRVDDALFVYERAKNVDPKRTSAERKHAELLFLQDRSALAIPVDYVPRNPYIAVFLSALLPGAGHLYIGRTGPALAIVVALLVDVLLIVWSPLGFRHRTTLTTSAAVLVMIGGAIYIYAVIDAMRSARAGRPRSGWDV